jgi:hypothetical protein
VTRYVSTDISEEPTACIFRVKKVLFYHEDLGNILLRNVRYVPTKLYSIRDVTSRYSDQRPPFGILEILGSNPGSESATLRFLVIFLLPPGKCSDIYLVASQKTSFDTRTVVTTSNSPDFYGVRNFPTVFRGDTRIMRRRNEQITDITPKQDE